MTENEAIDKILGNEVERQHYRKTVEIWADDCIASQSIVFEDDYPYAQSWKDLAHAIDGFNLDLNVRDLQLKEAHAKLDKIKEYIHSLNNTARSSKYYLRNAATEDIMKIIVGDGT